MSDKKNVYTIRIFLKGQHYPILLENIKDFSVKTKNGIMVGYEYKYHTPSSVSMLYLSINDILYITSECKIE